MIGYKLFRKRKDGSYGTLFFACRDRLVIGRWNTADRSLIKKGFKRRPGWHICSTLSAPHLSITGRVWCEVEFSDYEDVKRPISQGGLWHLANYMVIRRELSDVRRT